MTELIDRIYPVGSIYITVMNIDPGTVFGVGNWSAFAAGRTLVGIDTDQNEFKTVGLTGGSKAHVLTTTEMPSHTHGCGSTTPPNTGVPNNNSTDESGKHTHWIYSNLPLEVGLNNPDRGDTYSFADNLMQSGQFHYAHEDATIGNVRRSSAHKHLLNNHTHPSAAHSHTNTPNGGGGAHNNLQPYITVYMWQRVS